jgi:hypothetical protein
MLCTPEIVKSVKTQELQGPCLGSGKVHDGLMGRILKAYRTSRLIPGAGAFLTMCRNFAQPWVKFVPGKHVHAQDHHGSSGNLYHGDVTLVFYCDDYLAILEPAFTDRYAGWELARNSTGVHKSCCLSLLTKSDS